MHNITTFTEDKGIEIFCFVDDLLKAIDHRIELSLPPKGGLP